MKLVCSGAGAAALACLDLQVSLGLDPKKVFVLDSKGVVHKGRTDSMDADKARYAQETRARTLADVIEGADIFLGLSTGGVLTGDMVKRMADQPIILAMANPEPEIRPEVAKEARPDCLIGTGRSDYPNQVNNSLCFPFIFRGALDCGANTINEPMKLAATRALSQPSPRPSHPRSSRSHTASQRPRSAPTTSFHAHSIRGSSSTSHPRSRRRQWKAAWRRVPSPISTNTGIG